MFAGIEKYYREPLYRNSLAILLNTGSMAFFGLIFWVVAARTMPAGDVGVATAAVSASTLIASLARLGMDASLIRFFPGADDRPALYNTIQLITLLVSVALTAIFLAGIGIFSPSLGVLHDPANLIAFSGFTVLFSIAYVQNTALIALRHGDLSLVQNLILGIRIVILIALAAMGTFGVLGSYGIAYLATCLFGVYALGKFGIPPRLSFKPDIARAILTYSFGNYISGVLMIAPTTILPILVVDVLGGEDGAYFFIAYSIVSVLVLIPYAVSTSLFVEGSHDEPLRRSVVDSVKFTLLLLLPLLAIVFIFGEQLLAVFGGEYSSGAVPLLRVLAISSLFSAVPWIYMSIKKVQKDMRALNFVSLASAVLTIALGYVLMVTYGLIGIGYAWLLSNVLLCILIGAMVWMERGYGTV